MPVREKVFVSLGRYGDIIALLPLLYNHFVHVGRKPRLMVSRQYADVLDGVSYVDRIVVDLDREQLREAMQLASEYGQAVNAQAKGNGERLPMDIKAESFVRQPWAKLGRDERWEQISAVFDRRDFQREQELREELFSGSGGKPVVLVNRSSPSSPMADPDALALDYALSMLERDYHVVDISKLRAHRIYDVLGLLDHAHCLITIDTSILHLADASSVPVIALTNPDPWHASLPRANHVYHASYDSFDPDLLVWAVRKCSWIHRRYLHVHTLWKMSPADEDRYLMAQRSWLKETPQWKRLGLYTDTFQRNGSEVGDRSTIVYANDVIEEGMKHATFDEDAVVFTNTDIGFVHGIERMISPLLNRGACFAWRATHRKIDHPLDHAENLRGKWDGGLDLFAFTKRFWDRYKHEFPDVLIGCPAWDLLYRDIIKRLGGGELYGAIWHQAHESVWTINRMAPANRYNWAVYESYLKEHDRTRPYHKRWGIASTIPVVKPIRKHRLHPYRR